MVGNYKLRGAHFINTIGVKSSILQFMVAVILVAAANSADRVEIILPEFRGVMSIGRSNMFSLAAPGGENGTWLTLGDVFERCTLLSYDRKTDILTVELNGSKYNLSLSGGAMKPSERVLDRENARRYFSSFITSLEKASEKLVTYEKVPPDGFESLSESIKAAIGKRKRELEKRGGRLHVVTAADGKPLIISEEPLNFDRFGSAATQSLTTMDRFEINKRYLDVKIAKSYAEYWAHVASGSVGDVEPGGPGRPAVIPESMRKR